MESFARDEPLLDERCEGFYEWERFRWMGFGPVRDESRQAHRHGFGCGQAPPTFMIFGFIRNSSQYNRVFVV